MAGLLTGHLRFGRFGARCAPNTNAGDTKMIAALLDFLDMQMTFRRFDSSVSLVHWMMG